MNPKWKPIFVSVFLVILICVCIGYYVRIEHFELNKYKKHDYSYLYPTRDLEKECAQQNLQSAFMPKICVIDGEMEEDSNCKCQDPNTGECKVCYPRIPRNIQEREERIVYNANVI
jgi:hypothetical protein